MNGEYNTMFWLLVMTACISLIGIIASAKSLRNLVKSDFFIQRLRDMKNSDTVKAIVLIILSSIPGAAMAQEGLQQASEPLFTIGYNEVMAVAVINVILIGIILFLRKTIKDMMELIAPPKAVELAPEDEFVSKVTHILTDAVAVEDEHTILLDHEYDGIQELDNNLPPWWKYGFYLTIVVAVIYLLNYHVFRVSDLQIAEYEKSVTEAEAEVQAYLTSLALNVDEFTVTQLTDESALNNGKKIFLANCAVCHIEDGGGGTGPNMTDDYWIYGPDIKTVFHTIKYGAKNGMTPWQKKLKPIEIQEVASYLRTLHGTTPAAPKEPQGDFHEFILIEEEGGSVTDSTVVAQK